MLYFAPPLTLALSQGERGLPLYREQAKCRAHLSLSCKAAALIPFPIGKAKVREQAVLITYRPDGSNPFSCSQLMAYSRS